MNINSTMPQPDSFFALMLKLSLLFKDESVKERDIVFYPSIEVVQKYFQSIKDNPKQISRPEGKFKYFIDSWVKTKSHEFIQNNIDIKDDFYFYLDQDTRNTMQSWCNQSNCGKYSIIESPLTQALSRDKSFSKNDISKTIAHHINIKRIQYDTIKRKVDEYYYTYENRGIEFFKKEDDPQNIISSLDQAISGKNTETPVVFGKDLSKIFVKYQLTFHALYRRVENKNLTIDDIQYDHGKEDYAAYIVKNRAWNWKETPDGYMRFYIMGYEDKYHVDLGKKGRPYKFLNLLLKNEGHPVSRKKVEKKLGYSKKTNKYKVNVDDFSYLKRILKHMIGMNKPITIEYISNQENFCIQVYKPTQ